MKKSFVRKIEKGSKKEKSKPIVLNKVAEDKEDKKESK